ncbi:MAG: copper resistance protein CopC, partial [bacterium]
MLRRIAVSLAVPALAALAIHTALVYGHAEYDHSTPNAGQVVPTAPAQVDVYFTEEVAPAGTNTLNVLGPG